MISLFGPGFVGGRFAEMYPTFTHIEKRDERCPTHKDVLYFISTTNNYHVHNHITLDVDTNLKVLCETLDFCRSEDITFNFICNVMGVGDTKASKKKNAIQYMINELVNDRDIDIYDNGSHQRDVMHVDDVCRAIHLTITHGELNEIYNIGSGKPTAVRQLIDTAIKYTNTKGKVHNIEPPEFHKNVQTRNFWLDTTKLQDLGFRQAVSNESIVHELCL
jgi:nucleoside-diphosphate-sugar epimerase